MDISIDVNRTGSRGTARLLPAVILILILYPLPISRIQSLYSVSTAYIAWLVALPATFRVASYSVYWNSTTVLLWVLRWWAVVEYLLVSLKLQSITLGSLMALAGVIAPTFLYEFGVLVVLKGRLKMTLQWLVVLGVVSVFPVFVAALTALARGGINGLLLSTSALRQTYHSGWLNDVGLLMVVCFFAASYSGFSERWRRLLVPTCLLIAVTTLSRATAVALAMGLYLSAVLEKRRRWNELVLLGVGLMVVCLVFAGRSKVEGSSLYRTLLLRLSRWAAGLDVWVKSPWLGLGLRSFTEGVAEYVNPFSGVETSMGSAHNDYVDLLVRGGVSYVALFAVLISVWLYTLLKGAQRSRVDRLCIIVLLIILSASLVHNPLKYGIMSSMFWLFKGIGIAEHKRMLAEVKQERAVRRQPRPVSTLETKSQG